MGELTKSLEFMQSQLDEELGSVKKDITKLENNIKSIEKDILDPDDISTKLVELEDRSRRNNLQIDALQETPNEAWKEKVQEILKNKLGFTTEVEIDRCHRVKSCNQSGQNQGCPCIIICQFNKFKDKQQILKNAKKRHRHLHLQRFFKRYHGFTKSSFGEITTVSKTK